MEMICPKFVKSIEKSRFRSRSRDFCKFLKGLGIGFGESGLGKKSLGFCFGKFGLGKKYRFRFWRIWSQKKVSVSVSQNLVSSFNGDTPKTFMTTSSPLVLTNLLKYWCFKACIITF